jgi:hypothetical protein
MPNVGEGKGHPKVMNGISGERWKTRRKMKR